ncbi:MAG: DUF4157 domain-containing protein [Syntrophomonadaceae bacterium]|nr:DUF4157 domain-containing protein [Syntrophomonadaceae bacterium]
MSEFQEVNTGKATASIDKTPNQNARRQPLYNDSNYQLAMADPYSLSPQAILQLQSTIGNQAVMQLFRNIGKPDKLAPQAPVQKKENHTGLPDNIKSGVENLSGYDMSDIRVHYNSSLPSQIGALAYTQGSDIHVASGQERHLPHEAWHVAQQKQGRVRPTLQMKGIPVNDDAGLEREADQNAILLMNTNYEANVLHTGEINGANVVQGVFNDVEEIGHEKLTDDCKQYTSNRAKVDNEQQVNTLLSLLDRIEHGIYERIQYYQDNEDPLLAPMMQKSLYKMLDEAQREHEDLIEICDTKNFTPGIDTTGLEGEQIDEAQAKAKEIWNTIRGNDSPIKITDSYIPESGQKTLMPDEVKKKYRKERLSDIVRLTSREKGRNMVDYMMKELKTRGKSMEFMMPQVWNEMSPSDALTMKASAHDENAGMPESDPFGITMFPGKGSSSSIRVPIAYPDSAMVDLNKEGQKLPSPRFIGVGHEMNHAMGYALGLVGDKNSTGKTLLKDAGLDEEYDDMEELRVIGQGTDKPDAMIEKAKKKLGDDERVKDLDVILHPDLKKLPTEGELRQEHGLRPRYGHSNTMPNPYSRELPEPKENESIPERNSRAMDMITEPRDYLREKGLISSRVR